MDRIIIDRVPGKAPAILPQRPGHTPSFPQKEVPYEWHKERSDLKVVCLSANCEMWIMSI